MKRDITPFLGQMTLDEAALTDALTFASLQDPQPADRLEDILMALSSFVSDHSGSQVPNAHSAAVDALRAAASGLYGLLRMYEQDRPGWSVLSLVRRWFLQQAHQASMGLPFALVSSFVVTSKAGDLGFWRNQAAVACVEVQAGTYAGWTVALLLIESLPQLEDGYAEGMINDLLKGLATPVYS